MRKQKKPLSSPSETNIGKDYPEGTCISSDGGSYASGDNRIRKMEQKGALNRRSPWTPPLPSVNPIPLGYMRN